VCSSDLYESALAAYGGELLPEDRYHDWCAERRAFLAELRIRLLLELSDALKERGAQTTAADRLREALRSDPTREDVHRRLMVLHAEMGSRDQAVRQFQTCREALQRELGLLPAAPTLALYEEILADRAPKRIDAPARDQELIEEPSRDQGIDDSHRVAAAGPTQGTPKIGRGSVLHRLGDPLRRAGRLVANLGERSHSASDARARSRSVGARGSEATKERDEDRDRRRGFLIFRIAWVAAILVAAVVFLVGLFSGDSSQQRPDVALAPPAGGETQKNARKTKLAGPRHDRSRRTKEQAPGGGHSSSGAGSGSAAQTRDGGRVLVVEPQPTPQPTPQPSPQQKPAPSPQPKPTPAPPQAPVSSQPATSQPVQTTDIVANNNTGSP